MIFSRYKKPDQYRQSAHFLLIYFLRTQEKVLTLLQSK